MKLNAPKNATWGWGLFFGILGVAGEVVSYFITVPYLGLAAFWVLCLGFLLLLLGTAVKGM